VRTEYVVDKDGNQPVVAQARGGTFEGEDLDEHRRNKTDPWEANARLIAAAPDLLAALKGLTERLDHHFGSPQTWDWKEQAEARTAIAKAEGTP
jgi:hypothetical protein